MKQLINLMCLRTAPWAAISNPIPYIEIKKEVIVKIELFRARAIS